MSNLHRPRLQKYNARVLCYYLDNKGSIDKSQLSHLLAIQDKTIGLDEFKTAFNFKLDKGSEVAKLGYGRIYGNNGSGAYLEKDYRHNLYAKTYHDIDMANCHPTLLVQLAQRYNIKMFNLNQYVENREEYIKQVIEYYGDAEKTRADIKTEIIATLYGAEIPTFKMLKGELDALTDELKKHHVTLYDAVVNKRKKNVNGAFLSYLAQTEERKCLDAMDSYFLSMDRSVDDLAYDGLMIRKLNESEVFPLQFLRGAELFVLEKTGYKIKLEIKPMIQTISEDKLESKEEQLAKTYLDMKATFEKENAYYITTNAIIHKSSGPMEMRTIEHTREAYGHLTVKVKSKSVSFIDMWRKDPTRKIITKLVYKLEADLEEGEMSLFNGFQYKKYEADENAENNVKTFIDLVHAQCNNEQAVTDYMVNTFAHMIQCPFKKTNVLNAFASRAQGTGKDTLMLIIKGIIGTHHTAHYTSTEQYWSPYDTRREGAIFIYLEEACASQNKAHEGELKANITSDMVGINPKGMKAYTVPNIGRNFMTTNVEEPFKMTSEDRRFNIVRPSDRMKHIEWDAFYKNTVHNPCFLRNIGDFLEARDINGWESTKFPESQYRLDLKELVVSSEDRFLEQWTPDRWMTSGEMYLDYRAFCTENTYPYAMSTMSLCKKILPHKDQSFICRDGRSRVKFYLPKRDGFETIEF